VLLAHAYRYGTWQVRDAHTWSDGYYSWIYARSLAFDFDIDIQNDYALCGDPFHLGVEEGGGHPANPFYFGPALFLGPVLWVIRHVVKFGPLVSTSWRQGCTGPLVAYTGVASIFATALTMWIAYRVARRWYSEASCSIAVLVLGLASPLNIFGTLTWYYSHLWAALSVAVALLCAVRADERPESARRWFVAGLGVGLAALMRMQEALWLLVPFASIVSHFLAVRPVGDKAPIRTSALRGGLLTLGFVAVFGIQLYVFDRIYGSPFVIPQGKLYVQLSHAHPWLLMFGARSGFVYWTPLLWLPIVGAPYFVFDGRRRLMAVAIVIAACLNFYVASAALSWTGAATLGARVQTSLAAALLVMTAAFVSALIRWRSRRRAAAGTTVVVVLVPWIWLTWNAPTSGVPNDRPVPAPQLYAGGMTFGLARVCDAIGAPFTFPAGAVFFARYRAHPRVFDALASDGMFQKHYRNLTLSGADSFNFAQPPSAYWAEGIVSLGGADIGLGEHGRGRFLVTLYWPFVTSIRVTARPLRGHATLTIRSASFLRTRDVGVVAFSHPETIEIPVGAGVFDSGINEVLVSSDAPIALDAWQWIDTGAHDTSVRVFK
jgi:hypothetical protein